MRAVRTRFGQLPEKRGLRLPRRLRVTSLPEEAAAHGMRYFSGREADLFRSSLEIFARRWQVCEFDGGRVPTCPPIRRDLFSGLDTWFRIRLS